MYRWNFNSYPYIIEVAQLDGHIVYTANAVESNQKWQIQEMAAKPEVHIPLM